MRDLPKAPERQLQPDLANFLQAYTPTVEHLEVLLLMSSSPDNWWTVRALNEFMQSRKESIESRLREFAAKGLLDKSSSEGSYRLKEDPELEAFMRRLKSAYKNFRVRVIQTIYAPRANASSEFPRF